VIGSDLAYARNAGLNAQPKNPYDAADATVQLVTTSANLVRLPPDDMSPDIIAAWISEVETFETGESLLSSPQARCLVAQGKRRKQQKSPSPPDCEYHRMDNWHSLG